VAYATAAFQSFIPLRSVLPERFRGGCAFGAGLTRGRSLPQGSFELT